MKFIDLIETTKMRTLVIVESLGSRNKCVHTCFEWSRILDDRPKTGNGRYRDYEVLAISAENSALIVQIARVEGEEDETNKSTFIV